MLVNQYQGCLLGLALGDAFGADYEGGILERLLWRLIGYTADKKKRYTDDTQMSVDLISSFLHCQGIDQNHLAETFSLSYNWRRGYGPGAAKTLKGIRAGGDWRTLNCKQFKMGSYGNGAAMRAPVLSLFYSAQAEELNRAIVLASEITHSHPFAIVGAQLIGQTTRLALCQMPAREIITHIKKGTEETIYLSKLNWVEQILVNPTEFNKRDVKKNLGNAINAQESCVTAIYFSLTHLEQSFDCMLNKIIELGGDVDTIAAMAGAIWGAYNGSEKLDQCMLDRLEGYEELAELAIRVYNQYCSQQAITN